MPLWHGRGTNPQPSNPQPTPRSHSPCPNRSPGGGGIRLLDNWWLKSLGRLPATLTRVVGPVEVRGSLGDADVAALRAKAGGGGGGQAQTKKKK